MRKFSLQEIRLENLSTLQIGKKMKFTIRNPSPHERQFIWQMKKVLSKEI